MKKKRNLEKDAQGFNGSSKINEVESPESYAKNQYLQPREYLLSPKFVNFENEFEHICKEFLEKAKPDQYNGSYMDAIIQKMVSEALVYLSLQRAEHVDVITSFLNDVYIGDKIKCESKLEQATRVKADATEELKKIKKIYYNKTSFALEN